MSARKAKSDLAASRLCEREGRNAPPLAPGGGALPPLGRRPSLPPLPRRWSSAGWGPRALHAAGSPGGARASATAPGTGGGRACVGDLPGPRLLGLTARSVDDALRGGENRGKQPPSSVVLRRPVRARCASSPSMGAGGGPCPLKRRAALEKEEDMPRLSVLSDVRRRPTGGVSERVARWSISLSEAPCWWLWGLEKEERRMATKRLRMM
mmetsp:Transcript_16982/g.52391  ORF Transcript_16982/g.52391 Transcript_16982/m.52391 type:complete len:210 (+) Transcript_16982:3355-3984(+)